MSTKVFLDLGFSEDEAREHGLRAEIAALVSAWIDQQDMTQHEAAKVFRVPQPTISKIAKGNIENLSLGYLIRMLLRADLPFDIHRNAGSNEIAASIGNHQERRVTLYDEVILESKSPRRSYYRFVAESMPAVE